MRDRRSRLHMSVTRIHEDPRVTKPYTEEQWQAIDGLGHEIDERPARRRRPADDGRRADLRLDRRHGRRRVEHGRARAKRSAARRRSAPAAPRPVRPGRPAALRPGKWYPGRVAAALGLGLLLAARRRAGLGRSAPDCRRSADYGHSPDARPSASSTPWPSGWALIPALRCPATRTSGTTCGRNGGCRSMSTRSRAELDDPEERRPAGPGLRAGAGPSRRLRAAAARGRGDEPGRCWVSGRWFLRREHMFLLPGDSPMGYRLPLDSLPWAAPEDHRRRSSNSIPSPAPRSAADAGGADRHAAQSRPDRTRRRTAGPDRPARRYPGRPIGVAGLIRTALCVEPRDGRLHVFMPPQAALEDYLELVAAVEATARELHMPVVIEGYPPPARSPAESLRASRPIPA